MENKIYYYDVFIDMNWVEYKNVDGGSSLLNVGPVHLSSWDEHFLLGVF